MGLGDQGLDGLHHLPEQLVADTLDHHQNGGGVVLLELLGVDVQLKAAFGGGLQDFLPCPLADVGVIVQRPGNGADGIAGLCSQIFDCHGICRPSLFGIFEMPTGCFCSRWVNQLRDLALHPARARHVMMYFWQNR